MYCLPHASTVLETNKTVMDKTDVHILGPH